MGTRAWWRWMAVGLLALSCLAATPAPGRARSCADIAMTGEAVFIGHVVTVIPREWLQWLFLRPNLLRRHDLASLAVTIESDKPATSFAAAIEEAGDTPQLRA